MEFNQIKELINMINNSNITQFELQFEQVNIKLSKNNSIAAEFSNPINSSVTTIPTESIKETEIPKPIEKEGFIVKSPIVGTYYAAPSPEAPDFVKPMQEVKKGDVLCIIEAMKVMNEVKSPCDGVVSEIYVENEQILEYNQPIFLII